MRRLTRRAEVRRRARLVALVLVAVLSGGLLALGLPQPLDPARATGPGAGVATAAQVGSPLARTVEGYVQRSFRWDGYPRSYRYHLPQGEVPLAAAPLIVVLHGYLLDTGWAERTTGFDTVGDGHGAVVVYPEGLARSWNAGDCCDQAAKAGVDDADFVRGVVADLAARVPLDRRRVMLVGYSNGGMLAYQIACRTPQQLAGLVLVNASRQGRSCEPRTPVSIVAVHSRGDRTLPFAGQRYSRLLKVATRGVMASLDPFVADDACAEVRLTQQEIWESRTYRSCRSGSEVTLLVHPTLDHRWPTGLPGGSTVGALAWERLGARVAVEDFAGGRIPLQDPPAG